jgi:hypothetical protein
VQKSAADVEVMLAAAREQPGGGAVDEDADGRDRHHNAPRYGLRIA